MKILITGIAGTWGKEFTKQLLAEGHEVLGIDVTEQALAAFQHEYPNIDTLLMDIEDVDFKQLPVDVVIHLAAHKHIDICEKNVFEAVENNVTKTAKLFDNARRNGVKILFVSTDKAVEPASVYGFTKALGEHLAWEAGGQVARSGNIMGSNGSVLTVWDKAIKEHRPINITDPEMTRYFIEIETAVKRVWDGFNAGERLIIVAMGEPTRLGDLLDEVLTLHGFSQENYPAGITIAGRRPGEKQHERLTWDNE